MHYTAIPMRYRYLNISILDKGVNLFGLAVQWLDALQESGEYRVRVAALEASQTEQLPNIAALENHE